MTQNEMILEYLKGGHSLTGLDALSRFGVFRLAARCSDLRAEGYNIISESVTRNGKTFAEYRLADGFSRKIPADSFQKQSELLNISTIPIVTHV